METAVSIQDLSFRFGHNLVLDSINLEIGSRHFVGLVGPNGGGKTTLVKIILGSLKPLSGRVAVFGASPTTTRTRIGYVPQFALFQRDFPVTVSEMVLTGRLGHVGLGRRYRAEDRAVVDRVMEELDLAALAKQELQTLSGGELQRVMVARALATEPDMLILDEPTSSVDSRIETDFYEHLRALHERIPIILVSHDLGFISAYVTHVACLNQRLVMNPVNEVHAKDIEALYHAPVKIWSHDCEL